MMNALFLIFGLAGQALAGAGTYDTGVIISTPTGTARRVQAGTFGVSSSSQTSASPSIFLDGRIGQATFSGVGNSTATIIISSGIKVNAGVVAAPYFVGALVGNAVTATALTTAGSSCGTGHVSRGVDASGNCLPAAVPALSVPSSTSPAMSGDLNNVKISTGLSTVWQSTMTPTVGALQVWQSTATPKLAAFEQWQSTTSPVTQSLITWQSTASPVLEALLIWESTETQSTTALRLWQSTISPSVAQLLTWESTAAPKVSYLDAWMSSMTPAVVALQTWQSTATPKLVEFEIWQSTSSPMLGQLSIWESTAAPKVTYLDNWMSTASPKLAQFEAWQSTSSTVTERHEIWQSTISPKIAELLTSTVASVTALLVWESTASPIVTASQVWQSTTTPKLAGFDAWQSTSSPMLAQLLTWESTAAPKVSYLDAWMSTASSKLADFNAWQSTASPAQAALITWQSTATPNIAQLESWQSTISPLASAIVLDSANSLTVPTASMTILGVDGILASTGTFAVLKATATGNANWSVIASSQIFATDFCTSAKCLSQAGTGGGDVTAAGNNAFTGANTHSNIETFTSTVTIGPTSYGGPGQGTVASSTASYAAPIFGIPSPVAYSSFTAVTALNFVGLTSDYTYSVVLDIRQNTSDGYLSVRFNGDATTNYLWNIIGGVDNGTGLGDSDYSAAAYAGSCPINCRVGAGCYIKAAYGGHITFNFASEIDSLQRIHMDGRASYYESAGHLTNQVTGCFYPGGTNLRDLTIFDSAGTMTGHAILYATIRPMP